MLEVKLDGVEPVPTLPRQIHGKRRRTAVRAYPTFNRFEGTSFASPSESSRFMEEVVEGKVKWTVAGCAAFVAVWAARW